MSIIDNILNRMGYMKYVKPGDYENTPGFILETAASSKYTMPDFTLAYNQAELMARLSWVYTAVMYVANYAATVPLNVYRMRGERTIDIPNHEFEMLLYHPNPSQSRFELLNATFAYLRLNGNAYWWLNKSDENAQPDEIWVLPPYRVKPIPDGKMYLAGYEYNPGMGKVEIIPTWQVLHFRGFNPINEFVGLSGVEPLAVVAAGDLGQQKWNTKLYGKSNGRLPGVLAFGEYIQEPMWGDIKTETKSASDNRDYMMLRGVGKGGVELIAAPTPKDMEYIATRNFTKEEIFNVFAPGLSSVLSVNATEANARTGKSTLIDFAIWPMMEQLAQSVTNYILPSYGIKLKAEYDDIRITDRAMSLSEQAEFAKTHTINEIRDEYYSDDPLPDERGSMLIAQIGPSVGMSPKEQPSSSHPEEAEENPEIVTEETGENIEDEALSAEVKTDLDRWRRKALNAIKKGKPANIDFSSTVIPNSMSETIMSALGKAKTDDDVKEAFNVTVTKKSGEFDEIIAAIRDAYKALDSNLAK